MKKKRAKPTSLRRFVKSVKARKVAATKNPKNIPRIIPRPKLQPIAPALGPLVDKTAGHKGRDKGRDSWAKPGTAREKIDAQRLKSFGVSHYSPHADMIDPNEIKIGARHRKEFGDLKALAASIDDRGGLIQPIALKPNKELIAGERRIKAWALSRFAGQKIPCHYLDVDAIVAGEWDENAQRKDFTPSEAVAIKRSVEDVMRSLGKKMAEARPSETRAAPGRKAQPGTAAGRAADKVARYVGKDRKTLAKAEAVVAAAEQDPAKYGKLKEDMDRSGRVDGPFKRLEIMRASDAIRNAPPPLPDKGPYKTVVIDFPWPHEAEAEQDEIDARGRSLRPYPAMSIKSGAHYLREHVAPLLDPTVTVYFWVTNYHLVRGYHQHLLAALGFPDGGNTMLTWVKDKIGRGQILRDKTEHCIVLTRGNPVINVLGEDPPTTELRGPRRENSRKPDAFYRLVERVSPAPRYASIFSTGGEGELWDGHGDQAEKHELAAPAASADELTEWKALGAIEGDVTITGQMLNELIARNLIGGEGGRTCGWSLTEAGADRLAALDAKFNLPSAPIEPWQLQLAGLARISGDAKADISDLDPALFEGLIEGKRTRKLTAKGGARLNQLDHLRRLEDLDAVANGRAGDLPEAARKSLLIYQFVVGRNAKRLSKLGEKERLRLRDFRESFMALEAAAARAPASPQVPETLDELANTDQLISEAPAPRHDPALIAFAERSGHVVAMTIDWSCAGAELQGGVSVGTCQCGKVFRFNCNGTESARQMDAAIEDHWRAAAAAAAAAAAEADGQSSLPGTIATVDPLDIPPFLRRSAAE